MISICCCVSTIVDDKYVLLRRGNLEKGLLGLSVHYVKIREGYYHIDFVVHGCT